MNTTTTQTGAKIFLTDYASYNNGSQFEFGHWVDLDQFSDADELMEYISNHFKECNEKNPLDSPREEIMITDYEGFPESLYSESMSLEDFEKVYEYIEILEDLPDADDLEEWIGLHNEYCSEYANPDDQIWYNDEDFFNTFFHNDVLGAVRATQFGEFRYMDEYVTFNGYGNLVSFDSYSLKDYISIEDIIQWKING